MILAAADASELERRFRPSFRRAGAVGDLTERGTRGPIGPALAEGGRPWLPGSNRRYDTTDLDLPHFQMGTAFVARSVAGNSLDALD